MPQDDQGNLKPTTSPLIFISHDSRDAELADAFAKLLKSASAGMLKTFRSSSKKEKEGIEFGDEWFKRLMEKLDSATDVVCLLTKRSLDRPWILFEAGVAKGKFGGSVQATVQGIALGIPLSRVSASGPFYQFQNNDGSEDSLVGLVMQLCRRVPELEPDEQIVRTQVAAFRKSVDDFLDGADDDAADEEGEEVAGAKVVEEMKIMVRELSARMDEGIERSRHRRSRRTYPRAVYDLAQSLYDEDRGDPVGILIVASAVKEEMPWIYELAKQAYLAAQSGSIAEMQKRATMLHRAVDYSLHSSLGEELAADGQLREMMRIMEHVMHRQLDHVFHSKKGGSPKVSRTQKSKLIA